MPTYEYACRSCGEHLEVVQSFKDEALTECPNCDGALRKVFGNIGISFKGSGFYKTDSRSAPGKSSAAAASSDTSSSSAGDSSNTSGSGSADSGKGSSDSGKGSSDSGKGSSDSGKGSSSTSTAGSSSDGGSKAKAS